MVEQSYRIVEQSYRIVGALTAEGAVTYSFPLPVMPEQPWPFLALASGLPHLHPHLHALTLDLLGITLISTHYFQVHTIFIP